jgi:uncharacterized membrane protein YebE (DUF533 family)
MSGRWHRTPQIRGCPIKREMGAPLAGFKNTKTHGKKAAVGCGAFTHGEIAYLAYRFWQHQGCPRGA